MKQNEIIKALRTQLDPTLKEKGYKYDAKKGSYVRWDPTSGLYFEIAFVFMDYATMEDAQAKYLELFVNIYHAEVSKILCETSNRSFLGSLFSFPLVRNMLSDIVVNPDFEDYASRNNYRYFNTLFSKESDLREKPPEVLSIIEKHVLPFFGQLDSLEKICSWFDRSYEKNITLNNSNAHRLLALAVMLSYLKDPGFNEKVQRVKKHFASKDDKVSLEELQRFMAV